MHTVIKKELLEELYVKKKLTLKQIAQKLGKGYSTIHYWMEKHGIPRRPSPPKTFPISKEILFDLYLKKKLNTKQIAKIYGCDDETVREKLIEACIPRRSNSDSKTRYPKTPFSGDFAEKSYMLGLRTGDLYVKRNHALVRISTTTTHKLMLDLIKNVFGKYGHVMEEEGSKVRGNYIDVDLDKTFEFLLEKPKKIPEWILVDDKLFYAFLAGYIDADGCWTLTDDGRKGTRVKCSLQTQDKIILRQITDKLIQLGFSAHFYKKTKKGTVLSFGITRKNVYESCLVKKKEVVKLSSILQNYSKHTEKLLKIDLILNYYDKKWDVTEPKLEELRSFIKQNLVN